MDEREISVSEQISIFRQWSEVTVLVMEEMIARINQLPGGEHWKHEVGIAEEISELAEALEYNFRLFMEEDDA